MYIICGALPSQVIRVVQQSGLPTWQQRSKLCATLQGRDSYSKSLCEHNKLVFALAHPVSTWPMFTQLPHKILGSVALCQYVTIVRIHVALWTQATTNTHVFTKNRLGGTPSFQKNDFSTVLLARLCPREKPHWKSTKLSWSTTVVCS